MLGLCCQWLDDSGKNKLISRSMQLGRWRAGKYDNAHMRDVYVKNLQNLLDYLPIIYASGIRVFRMSSSMFPLWDLAERRLWDNYTTLDLMGRIGKFVTNNGMRLTTHPGQFVVLSSPHKDVRDKAIAELNFHGWVFDRMGLPRTPFYAINVHGGGKSERFPFLCDSIVRLDDGAAKRLTLENCEFGWSVVDLHRVYKSYEIPIVFDSHHHRFNDGGLLGVDAMTLAMNTWKKIKPLTHLSNTPVHVPTTASKTKLRAHSDYIRYIPQYQQKANNDDAIDIDVEAKKKNHAIFDMVKKFKITI
jgi:UV DNA damage endonuclease